MTLQALIHQSVHDTDAGGVLADQMRSQLGETGARTSGISGQVGRTERANLAVADEARVGLHADHSRVINLKRLAARPTVAAFPQRQIDLIDEDARDSHECT